MKDMNMNQCRDTGERIRALRHRMGLSQSKFATYFGIPVRTIQKWEQGAAAPPVYVISMMERLYNMNEQT